MRKIILSFFLGFLFILASSVFSLFAEEQITITTYYPSPYGSYQDLYVANELGIGTTNPASLLHLSSSDPVLIIQDTDTGYTSSAAKIKFGESDASGNLDEDWSVGYNSSKLDFALNDVSKMVIDYSGNVGIGIASPTVQFERACPSGFTNVKAGNNQLGCIETALHGTGVDWFTAANTCFTAYGARLPLFSEWYVAMNNFSLTINATYPYEWLGNSDYYSQAACAVGTSTVLTAPSVFPPTQTVAVSYRCWIPR